MTGQGRPHIGAIHRLPRGGLARLLAAALCVVALASSSQADESAVAAMRVRVEWGGGVSRDWRVALSAKDGKLADPVLLGIDADEPGSARVEGASLIIDPPRGRVYDGVDVSVFGSVATTLKLELSAEGLPDKIVEIPLARLRDDVTNEALDTAGNRLLARRAPGDRLRVQLKHDSLVFRPREHIELDVELSPLDPPPALEAKLEARLQNSKTGQVLSTSQHELPSLAGSPSVSAHLSIQAPLEEGVYDLVLTLGRRGIPERLGIRSAGEERRVQLVVVSPERPRDTAEPAHSLELIMELDPATPRWWERLPALPVNISWLPGMRRGPLGNGFAQTTHDPLGAWIRLSPATDDRDLPWEAYPLPVARPGQPHVVEIDLPANMPQTLGLSIVEPNAAGAVMPIGLDSGVYLPAEAQRCSAERVKHRLPFWPRTSAPLLLVTNRQRNAPAQFGMIRLYGPRAGSISSLGRGSPPSRLEPHDANLPTTGGRLLAVFFSRPLTAETFSAPQAVDPWNSTNGRTLIDWNTTHDAATRLAQYLHHSGGNAAVMTVLAEGSAIYPSRALEATPRYDDGVFFQSGQDPVRKDMVELYLRVFDREKLRFIPALDFSARLPALEILRDASGRLPAGIEPVDADGSAWSQLHALANGMGPHYNALDPRVQNAMIAVARELVERYGKHESFSGLALQLSSQGYAVLPGGAWCLDDGTLNRFAAEMKIDWGSATTSRARRAAVAVGKHQATWLQWRAHAMRDFYQRLHAEIAPAQPAGENAPARQLFLTSGDLFVRADLQERLQPALPQSVTIARLELELGIDPALYAKQDQLVLARTRRVAPMVNLPRQGGEVESNQDRDLDHVLADAAYPAALFYHEPLDGRLPSFDAKSPFRPTLTRLTTQALPADLWNRARFAHALAALDAQAILDGGALLPLGQEAAARDWIIAYRQLPAGRFQTVATQQPVAIRSRIADQRTYLYLVNDSPWPTTVELNVDGPDGAQFRPFGAMKFDQSALSGAAPRKWTASIEPYGLLAGSFDRPDVKFTEPKVQVTDEATAALDARIRGLWTRAASLKSPPAVDRLPNAGFEANLQRDGSVQGWRLAERSAGMARLDADEHHEGAQSLRLSGGPLGAELRSEPMPTPPTGRLSVSVWARVANEAAQPALRLLVRSTEEKPAFVRFARLGAGPEVQPLTARWAQYVFQVPDVPTTGGPLEVAFALDGPGEVWIDHVRLYDLDFSEAERLELSKTITLAEYQRSNGQLSACHHLLDGYWPRFLEAFVPESPTVLAQRSAAPSASPPGAPDSAPVPTARPAATAPPPERRSMFDRWRSVLPSGLR